MATDFAVSGAAPSAKGVLTVSLAMCRNLDKYMLWLNFSKVYVVATDQPE